MARRGTKIFSVSKLSAESRMACPASQVTRFLGDMDGSHISLISHAEVSMQAYWGQSRALYVHVNLQLGQEGVENLLTCLLAHWHSFLRNPHP